MMEFGNSFYILLGIILFIGFVGMIGNIQLAAFYRYWLKQLKEYERKSEFHLQSDSNHLIQEMVDEYTRHRSEGIEFMNTQAIIEQSVYSRQFNLFGFFRLPIGVVERIVQQLPSWTIILGLLGTFSGLTMALFAMQGTLLQLGADSGAEVISVSTIVASIAEPFKGMSFAFITSIAGIGMAFLLNVLHSGLLSKLGLGPSSSQSKQLFLTRCESFLDHHVQQIVQKQKPKDSMERLLDRLVEKVKESFDQSVSSFGHEVIKMTQKLEGSLIGLEKVVEQSVSFTEQFHQGTSQLGEFGKVLQVTIEKFQHHEEQVAGRIEQLSQQLKILQQELKQLTTKSTEGHQSLQKVVERSDQMLQQSMRKSEEMFKFFQSQSEEMQRRIHERFEEQQRINKQNQDEWQYRYQEKNDQFSRAAESFGQAVQNLERQWEDGLERFKRDAAGQWGQILEKYFGRQQGHNQTERELKEMVRELENIQHLLDREFQSMHRFSNDISQILINMYEWGRSQMSPQRRYEESDSNRSPVVRERRY
jgi:hypothetical protein